jgi:hypothetical protein
MPDEDIEWSLYLIRNAANGKGYVGLTSLWPLEVRLHQHFAISKELPREAYMSNMGIRPLYAAMRKYGVEQFSIELLGATEGPDSLYEAREFEKAFIEDYETYGRNGYNVTEGGEWPFDPD